MPESHAGPASVDYQHFLSTPTRRQWETFGLMRRAGVSAPLFSIYSRQSTGIGEIPDLKLLVDWCRKTRMSIIQLLPLNDTGFTFTPYDAQSTFALDPMYLCLGELSGISSQTFSDAVGILRKQFPAGTPRVNYGIKKAKLDLLWKIFQASDGARHPGLTRFKQENQFWLQDYALFKVIKEGFQENSWEIWPEDLKNRNPEALHMIETEHGARLLFHQWLQWQLYEQFLDVKQYAREQKVYLMGDLPFLVSRDSADVWAHQDYFKLDLSAGAPPDAFFAKGQRWGMPPYRWAAIEARGYDYLIEKVKYAGHFYDMFRIDHVVGTFRLWTIPLSQPVETHGLYGQFDPPEESQWEEHGRKLLSVMIQSSAMLPCAEDLGVIPDCCPRTLWDFAIPGMEVQRWTKEWHADASFRVPEHYRKNAVTVISNHDTTSFQGWWEFDAGTADEELLRRIFSEKQLDLEALKPQLFDLSRSSHGRLRWNDSIENTDILSGILQRAPDQIGDILEIYKGSFQEKQKFWSYAGLEGKFEEKASPKLIQAAMEKTSVSAALFNIQLLQDLLDLGPLFEHDAWEYRINFPGTAGPQNWSLVIPVSLEEMNQSKLNGKIKKIHELGQRQ